MDDAEPIDIPTGLIEVVPAWLWALRGERWSTKTEWRDRQLKLLARYPAATARAALEHSMAMGWRSVHPDKVTRRRTASSLTPNGRSFLGYNDIVVSLTILLYLIYMRHPSRKQDPLQTPLNDILGSRGAVRALRVLAEAGHPIGRAQVARKAGLNASGVRRTLDRLAAAGIIEVVGSGRNLAVRLRDEHPLTEPLRSLFHAERRLFAGAVDILRGQLSREDLPVKAIWIESLEARSPGMVDIGVLADPPALESSVATVQGYLEAAEEAMGMHFTVRGYTDADRFAGGEQERRLGDVTLLHGWIPAAWRAEAGGPIATHRELDRRTRRLAKAVADLLPNDPSLVSRAADWIDGRLAMADERASHELNEWRRILSTLSVPQIQALLTQDTERADRLRQSLPFVEALSPTDRAELLEKNRL